MSTRIKNFLLANLCVSRWLPHDVFIRRFNSQTLCWGTVHDDVDPQYLHGVQGVGGVHQGGEGDQGEGGNTCAHLELNQWSF